MMNIKYSITLVLSENHNNVHKYQTYLVPNVGDYISLENDKKFKVNWRLLPTDINDNNISLYGIIPFG